MDLNVLNFFSTFVIFIYKPKNIKTMSINATCSVGNTDRMNGYLEGYAEGQKCGMNIMKMKACREFSKILA